MFAVNFDMFFILAVIYNIHEYVFALGVVRGGDGAYTTSESIIKYQAFSPSYDLGPPPPPCRQQVISHSQSSCVSPVELTDGRGGGGVREELNHATTRKPRTSLLNINVPVL